MKTRPTDQLQIVIRLLPFIVMASVTHANSAFSGLWTISAGETTSTDPAARSTALDPWRKLDMAIEVKGDTVAIVRTFGGGSRVATETMTVDTSLPGQEITVEGWWDNRHIGAYLGNDKRIHVSAKWLDSDRTLQLMIDMVLETSQTDTPVRVIREMRLSDDGDTLVVIELRSSRDKPIVRYFKRA
ncbi:MAG: hypothetical protein R3F07_16430 [Opitutaceae bacterium]